MPIRYSTAVIPSTVEFAAVAGLVLFLVSELLPFTPLKGNGIADAILKALIVAFPKPEADEK